MKSEKGITLISLTIYIITMAIMIGVISIISSYFYTNINDVESSSDVIIEYTKFNNYFSDEVNHLNIKVLDCKNNYTSKVSEEDINYIVFDNDVQYTYIPSNKSIYRNKVKICKEVEKCEFLYEIENGKDVVTTNIKIKDKEYQTKYTLKK